MRQEAEVVAAMKDTTAYDSKGRNSGDEVRMMWRSMVWVAVGDGKGASEARQGAQHAADIPSVHSGKHKKSRIRSGTERSRTILVGPQM